MSLLTEIKDSWQIVFLIVPIILIFVALFSQKRIETQILIPADASEIWSVLISTASYENWHPLLIPISGSLKKGNTIRYKWNKNENEFVQLDAKVIELNENKLLHQRGGISGILSFDHRYRLEQEDGATKVIQSEVYQGIGVWFWDASQMQAQYQKVNKALQLRVLSSLSSVVES